MTRFKVLHISDLHFSSQAGRQDIRQIISSKKKLLVLHQLFKSGNKPWYPSSFDPDLAEAVARIAFDRKHQYDVILISGDLATTGLEDDLSSAYDFVSSNVVTGWMNSKRKPTLFAAERDVMLLPGNHDRYADNLGEPGGDLFSEVFKKYWPLSDYIHHVIIRKKDADSLAFVFADFTLKYTTEATNSIWRYGQGRVTKERITALVDRTSNLRSENPHIAVVWVMHFLPEFGGTDHMLSLINSNLLLNEAQECGIQVILAGHTHKARHYKLDSIKIFCSGTATSIGEDEENSLHFLEFDVNGNQIISFESSDYYWDQTKGNFVERIKNIGVD